MLPTVPHRNPWLAVINTVITHWQDKHTPFSSALSPSEMLLYGRGEIQQLRKTWLRANNSMTGLAVHHETTKKVRNEETNSIIKSKRTGLKQAVTFSSQFQNFLFVL